MSTHGAAGRLVGQHAITVVLDVGNVVQGAQQRARIKNSHHAVRAIGSTILHHPRLHSSDATIVLHASLEINDRPRPPTVGPEDLFPGVGDLHRSARCAGCDCRDDFEGNHFALAAKPAAHEWFDHANLEHGHFEHQ